MDIEVRLNVNPFKGDSSSPVELKKNKPFLIFSKDSGVIFSINEQDEENDVYEVLNISSKISNDDCALIGYEYKNPLVKAPKAADMIYIHFSKTNEIAQVYVYDLKRSLGGKDIILKLIYQLEDSLIHAKNIVASLKKYSGVYTIGVVTESYDRKKLEEQIAILQQSVVPNPNVPSFVQAKKKTQTIIDIQELKYIKDFYRGIVRILGVEYKVDIHYFKMQEKVSVLEMNFIDGVLQ